MEADPNHFAQKPSANAQQEAMKSWLEHPDNLHGTQALLVRHVKSTIRNSSNRRPTVAMDNMMTFTKTVQMRIEDDGYDDEEEEEAEDDPLHTTSSSSIHSQGTHSSLGRSGERLKSDLKGSVPTPKAKPWIKLDGNQLLPTEASQQSSVSRTSSHSSHSSISKFLQEHSRPRSATSQVNRVSTDPSAVEQIRLKKDAKDKRNSPLSKQSELILEHHVDKVVTQGGLSHKRLVRSMSCPSSISYRADAFMVAKPIHVAMSYDHVQDDPMLEVSRKWVEKAQHAKLMAKKALFMHGSHGNYTSSNESTKELQRQKMLSEFFSTGKDGLKRVLMDIGARRLFKQSLEKRFETSDFKFWKMAETYRHNTKSNIRQSIAMEMMQLFIEEKAPEYIGLPDHIRTDIISTYSKLFKNRKKPKGTKKIPQKNQIDEFAALDAMSRLLDPSTFQPKAAPASNSEWPSDLFVDAQTFVFNRLATSQFTEFIASGEYVSYIVSRELNRPIRAATLDQLVENLANVRKDGDFQDDFLLTHSLFIEDDELLETLIKMYYKSEHVCDAGTNRQAKANAKMQQAMIIDAIARWMELDEIKRTSDNIQKINALSTHLINRGGTSSDMGLELKRLCRSTEYSTQAHISKKGGNAEGIFARRKSNTPAPRLRKLSLSYSKRLSSHSKMLNTGGASPLQVSPKDLAAHLTCVEWEYFRKIRSRELLNNAWLKENAESIAPNVTELVKQFNFITYWAATEIMMAKDHRTRVDTVEWLIETACHCLHFQNFHAVFELFFGLSMVPIQNLKAVWEDVSKKHSSLMAELENLVSPRKSWKQYRDYLCHVEPPFIAFEAVFFQDLVAVQETTDAIEGMINVEKMELIGSVLRTLKHAQKGMLVTRYSLNTNTMLTNYFKTAAVFTEDRLYSVGKNIQRFGRRDSVRQKSSHHGFKRRLSSRLSGEKISVSMSQIAQSKPSTHPAEMDELPF